MMNAFNVASNSLRPVPMAPLVVTDFIRSRRTVSGAEIKTHEITIRQARKTVTRNIVESISI
jgi:hypothetical protein